MKIDMNKFEYVEHMPLRVYNRSVQTYNLMEDFSPNVASEYLGLFNQNERKQIMLMLAFIRKNGKEKALKVVTKDLKTEYNPEQDVIN